MLTSPPRYVHERTMTDGASVVLIDDYSSVPGKVFISGDTNVHFQVMQPQYRCRLASHKVLHSSKISEVVNDVSMTQ